MTARWKGSADLPTDLPVGNRGFALACLEVEPGGVRITVTGGREALVSRDEVAKVYVCREFGQYALCFQMKDARDYVVHLRRKHAKEAFQAVEKAGYPVTRNVYRPYYGRIDQADTARVQEQTARG
ncbi:hypothetical protein [Actinomadura parmotrematis]|uniref:Uncharacterized protein n=1 Tax=Actinomadura parmotrematis TaxID=2864039 RepID=A0ABS7G4U5_9ACTN|nr:hypothetical protein [Actinomadura parmotrematis]MBW8487760.1 hypothetical protein [Actinomadura parmotrematis]